MIFAYNSLDVYLYDSVSVYVNSRACMARWATGAAAACIPACLLPARPEPRGEERRPAAGASREHGIGAAALVAHLAQWRAPRASPAADEVLSVLHPARPVFLEVLQRAIGADSSDARRPVSADRARRIFPTREPGAFFLQN